MTRNQIQTRYPTLRALLDGARNGQITDADWTELPTYGGEEPRDTNGVWSWDETHLLTGTCAADYRIEPRTSDKNNKRGWIDAGSQAADACHAQGQLCPAAEADFTDELEAAAADGWNGDTEQAIEWMREGWRLWALSNGTS